jgi:hypothetical protein
MKQLVWSFRQQLDQPHVAHWWKKPFAMPNISLPLQSLKARSLHSKKRSQLTKTPKDDGTKFGHGHCATA